MSEDTETQTEVTSDDKLWAAIGYPIPIVPIIVLLMEDKKDRPFLRFHAIQSIAFNVLIWVAITILSVVTLGIGAICAPVVWLATLWPAFDSYNGNLTQIPVVTDFNKTQNWVELTANTREAPRPAGEPLFMLRGDVDPTPYPLADC